MPELIPPYYISEPLTAAQLAQGRDWGMDSLKIDDQIWEDTKGEGVLFVSGDTGYAPHNDGKKPEFVETFAQGNGIDKNGHGIHTQGTVIAQDNEFGFVGVAPEAGLASIQLLGDNGSNTTDNINRGYYWLADWWKNRNAEMRAKYHSCVLNLSLGGPPDGSTKKAIDALFEAGVVAVAAMGNSGRKSYEAPGIYSIGVGAIDINDNKASFSTYNEHCDIACPGVNVISFGFNNRWVKMSGTSMASPYAAGCITLFLSSYRDKELRTHDGLLEAFSRRSPFDLGSVGKDQFFGWGKPNVKELVKSSLFDFGISEEDS